MKTRRAVPKTLVIGLLCLAFGGLTSIAYSQQTFDAEIRVPVTFYDFRSDRSNPEFEQPHDGNRLNHLIRNNAQFPGVNNGNPYNMRVATGMVANLLDKDKKPVMGEWPYMNHGVRFWFRDWNNPDSYNMNDSTVVNVNGVLGNNRGYLEKFRPFYMYKREGDAGSNEAGRNQTGVQYTAYPPMPALQSIRDGARINDAGHSGRLGIIQTRDEWNAPVRSNVSTVPYIYADALPPSLRTTVQGGTGVDLHRSAGFTITGTPGNQSARLNFGTADNYDYTIDDAFTNMKIDTVLVFTNDNVVGGFGTTPFYHFDDQAFFPLRGKGFTNSAHNWISHGSNPSDNFAFSMEMVWEFKMESGLVFDFRGDDDVWVFINDRLALDLGGVHMPATGEINLNNLRTSHGLVDGNVYELRMFYVERHTTGSSIRIRSNIVSAIPRGLEIEFASGDTIKAGVEIDGRVTVLVDTGAGKLNDPAGDFYWTVTDVTTGISADERNIYGETMFLRDLNGNLIPPNTPIESLDAVRISAQRAYTQLAVTVRYSDPRVGTADTTIYITVAPGDPAKVVIENSPEANRPLPGGRSALRTSAHMDTIFLTGNTNNQFYGIVRDEFDNWVQTASAFTQPRNPPYNGTVAWNLVNIPGQSPAASIATIMAGGVAGQQTGQGSVTRAADGETGGARANIQYQINTGGLQRNLLNNSVVFVPPYQIAAVRVGVLVNGAFVALVTSPNTPEQYVITPQTVNMEVGGDTTLYVQVLRNDWQSLPENQRWIGADAQWGAGGGIFASAPSTIASSASFSVNSAGTGQVTAVAPGVPASQISLFTASVPIVVALGDPVSMRFYGNGQVRGTDTTNARPNPTFIHPLPPTAVTAIAGQPLPMVPKLFADNTTNANMWVWRGIEPNIFSWSFAANSPTNDRTSINAAVADSALFISTYAHETYRVIGTYTTTGGRVVSCSLSITVVPDTASKRLVIEPGYNAHLQVSQKMDELIFDMSELANKTVKSVYAVVRDRYGNFIRFADFNANPNDPFWIVPPDSALITAVKGDVAWAEGRVTPEYNGNVSLKAVEGLGVNQIRDSIVVRILAYTYDSLAIAIRLRDGETCIEGVNGCIVTRNHQDAITGYYESYAPVAITQAEYNNLPADQRSITADYDQLGNLIAITGWYRIDPFIMNSNQDVTFYTLGRTNIPPEETGGEFRNGIWEPATANWRTDIESALGTPPTGSVNSWLVSPRGDGTGEITASRQGSGLSELSGTLNIKVLVGPPTGVTLQIIDNGNLRAGQDITGIIRYTNRAGVITKWDSNWSKNVWLGDILGISGGHIPTVKNADGSNEKNLGYLNMSGSLNTPPVLPFFSVLPGDYNATLNLSDTRAHDTLIFRIFLASDIDHQIRIYHPNVSTDVNYQFGMGTSPNTYVTALSNNFRIRAGDLADIKIEERNPGENIPGRRYVRGDPDTIVYSFRDGGQDLLTAVGYDAWGNRIGPQESNWSTSDSIPDPSSPTDGASQILYDSRRADYPGSGIIIVVALDKDGNPTDIRDTIYVRIENVTVSIMRAVTRDSNSSGYLDGIELEFAKPVTIDDENKLKDVTVSFSGTTLEVIGVQRVNNSSETWLLVLKEDQTTRTLQTGWTPNVVIPEGLFADVARRDNLTAVDGAAPVIFRALKYFAQNDHEQDIIKVVISEAFAAQHFTSLNLAPKDLFNIWSYESGSAKRQRLAKAASDGGSCTYNGRGIAVDEGRLDGIPPPMRVAGDTIQFSLGSRLNPLADLTTSHFINIRVNTSADPASHLGDNAGNVQGFYCNRVVPITYGNAPPMEAKTIPNPSSPTPNNPVAKPGDLNPWHDPTAADWVRDNKGGSIVRVPVYVPGATEGKVRCQIKVYDLVGNLVHAAKTDDLAGKSGSHLQANQEKYVDIDLYWNGYNSKGMKVAPGTYRLIVQFDYEYGKLDRTTANELRGKNKFTAPVGVSK